VKVLVMSLTASAYLLIFFYFSARVESFKPFNAKIILSLILGRSVFKEIFFPIGWRTINFC
jgi:hypothetical protein